MTDKIRTKFTMTRKSKLTPDEAVMALARVPNIMVIQLIDFAYSIGGKLTFRVLPIEGEIDAATRREEKEGK